MLGGVPDLGGARHQFGLPPRPGLGENDFQLAAQGLAADSECACDLVEVLALADCSGQARFGVCKAKNDAEQCLVGD